MEFAGGNPDLGAEAELAAIGELRRGVVQHDRGIDLAEEFLGGLRLPSRSHRCGASRGSGYARSPPTPSTTRAAMMASRYSVSQSSSVAGFTRIDLLHGVVAAHLAAGIDQHLDQRLQRSRQPARSTSRVSAAPQTPVRRILAFSTIDLAMSRLAVDRHRRG